MDSYATNMEDSIVFLILSVAKSCIYHRLDVKTVQRLLLMHTKMAPSPSNGIGTQKCKTTKEEFQHQLLWSYGVACANWADDNQLRCLMDQKYTPNYQVNELLARLLEKSVKNK